MEVEMSKTAYTWEDKYRPRKPRYFNKVHTGYEWNKYNQTHYELVHLSPHASLTFILTRSSTAPTTRLPRSSKDTSSTSSTPISSTSPPLRTSLLNPILSIPTDSVSSDHTSSSRRRAMTIPALYSSPAERRTKISPSPSSTDPGVRPTSSSSSFVQHLMTMDVYRVLPQARV